MITSITKSNAPDYTKYFAEVTEYLQTHDSNGKSAEQEGYSGAPIFGTDDAITSLEEVFDMMLQLRTIKPELTKLPLDEEPFEINLDTRMIVVPSHFVKNGISVQGDEIAEAVYFKCARYYDHIDLSTRDIYVEYTNADGDSKVSIPPVVDIESEPGYIIFEWPISADVTEKAGTVNFAVRFYSYNGQKLEYSLSTLTQSIKINPCLDFNIVEIKQERLEDEEDNKDLMISRLKEDIKYGTGASTAVASKPIFWDDYKLVETMNLAKDDNGFTSIPVEKSIQAYSEDAGQITYLWEKYTLNLQEKQAEYSQQFIETKDEEPLEGKVYYIAAKTTINEDGEEVISSYALAGSIEEFDEDVKYFEKVSTGIIDEVGYYKATAINRVKTDKKYAYTPDVTDREDVNYNYLMLVPAASDVEDAGLPEKLVLVAGEEEDTFIGVLTDETTLVDADGKFTYQWKYKGTAENAEWEDIDEATGDTLNLLATAAPNKDGFYKVEITNHLNNTTTDDESNVCRVTHPASRPTVLQGCTATPTFNFAKNTGLSIEVNIEADANEVRSEEDTITYQWYRYKVGRFTNEVADTDKAANGEYVVNEDIPMGVATTSDAGKKLFLSDDDWGTGIGNVYFCEVTNKYNGNEAKRCSAFFKVQLVGDDEVENA